MISLTHDEYLSHELWRSDDVLRVTNASLNPGHRFKIHLFDTPEKLCEWHGVETARTLRRRLPNAVGSLSALPSVISRYAVGPEPAIHEVKVGDRIETNRGVFEIVEIPYRNPFLVPVD